MRINKEILNKKLNEASDDVRNAVMSENTMNVLSDIAKEFNLHIDQAGILEEEVLYTILGIQTSEEFIKRISREFNLSRIVAQDIASEVNEKVSGFIRNEIQNKTNPTQTPQPDQNPSRETILSEIENPTPSIHPISSSDQTIPGPRIPTEIIETNKNRIATQHTADNIAHDFIGGKLTEPVNLPTKRTTIDPYREPLE